MELRVLRYFLTIAREESISGAAAVLHISQPTLSRQIRELEEMLGTKLLIRGNRNVTLTESGMLLRKRAEEIVSLVDRTESELITPDEILSGDICIGCGETDAMRMVARTAKKIQHENPDIRFHLFSGNAEDVKERLDKGLLDFGVLIEPADIKKYDSLRLPVTDTWGVLLRKDHPLASRTELCPEDLHGLPLICSRQSMDTDMIAQWIGKDMKELPVVATYNLVYNASLLVDEGLGVALTLEKLINTTGDSSLKFIPLEPVLPTSLDLVWKKYQIFSDVAALFLKELRKEIGLAPE